MQPLASGRTRSGNRRCPHRLGGLHKDVRPSGPRFPHLEATWQEAVRGGWAAWQARGTHSLPQSWAPRPPGAGRPCPAVGLAKNMPSAPGARTAWFKESVLLLQRGVGPEKQDPWIYHRTKSGWGPADPSPPARLLATRPCCGPGPERRPVLGEAPRFHAQAKGKNVRLDGHSRRATRRNSFCNGVTFTQRPIRLYEQVRLRLVAVRPGWSGALRFGFTAHDPSLMSAQDIPKYACPDLVTRPGYWAKALPENLALRDTVLAYWADRHGRVFYSVNDGEPVLFHCGVAVGGPLWALIDVYGITDEVQLLGRSRSGPSSNSLCMAVDFFHILKHEGLPLPSLVLTSLHIFTRYFILFYFNFIFYHNPPSSFYR
ncbi:E3 ubiquitin-protein ligase NEURL1B isoform X1 [Crocuta crocuta]